PRDQAFAFIDASRGRVLGDGNADGVAMSSSAVTVGRQIQRGAWDLGAAVGTLTLGATRNGIGDGMTSSLYRIGVFAARPVGVFRLGGLLGYTGGQVGYGLAQRDAGVWSLQTRVARDFQVSPANVLTPLLSLDMQRLRLGGATESDPVLGLQVGAQGLTESSSLGALRGVHAWNWNGLSGDLSASFGVRHWWKRPPAVTNLSFTGIPGLSFTTWGVAAPRNMLEATVGMHAALRQNLSAEVSLQGDYGRGVRAGRIDAHLVWGF
ncbi:MAG: autotransporter outer membrane beta-barrel domain-containing protein, partial [Betaproteobacteria bacterium]|nr:autotransporter outer membrane beta-barrel domain-containing protein [Betaproteobacteria bacterium]